MKETWHVGVDVLDGTPILIRRLDGRMVEGFSPDLEAGATWDDVFYVMFDDWPVPPSNDDAEGR